MNITLQKSQIANRESKVTITGSKSETNRLLILKQFYPNFNY